MHSNKYIHVTAFFMWHQVDIQLYRYKNGDIKWLNLKYVQSSDYSDKYDMGICYVFMKAVCTYQYVNII